MKGNTSIIDIVIEALANLNGKDLIIISIIIGITVANLFLYWEMTSNIRYIAKRLQAIETNQIYQIQTNQDNQENTEQAERQNRDQ